MSTLVLAATLFGGMASVILVLAAGLGVYVWMRPEEGPGAALLFLFAAQILLPIPARFNTWSTDMSPMYYWAAGALIITLAAVLRLGLRRVFAVPLSAIVFLSVALASAVYAETQGAATSYVVRQFYGALLLVAYLGIALHAGDEPLLSRRARTFGVLCALCFVVYYVAVFGEYGFHRETGTHGAQASMFAILLVIAGLNARKRLWVLSALLMLLVPALLFMRRDLLAFLVALPIALAVRARTWKRRLAYCCFVALLVLLGMYPPVAQSVGEELQRMPLIGEVIPPTTESATSVVDRVVQARFALDALRDHPWLGGGLGSTFQWDSPSQGFLEGGYVDNGWAYLFQKMGLMGAAAFLWLLITIFRGISRKSVGLSACLLSATLVIMFGEPVFFHFTTAPFLGTFAGLLLAKKDRARQVAALSRQNVS
jgi:O-antigen ligase